MTQQTAQKHQLLDSLKCVTIWSTNMKELSIFEYVSPIRRPFFPKKNWWPFPCFTRCHAHHGAPKELLALGLELRAFRRSGPVGPVESSRLLTLRCVVLDDAEGCPGPVVWLLFLDEGVWALPQKPQKHHKMAPEKKIEQWLCGRFFGRIVSVLVVFLNWNLVVAGFWQTCFLELLWPEKWTISKHQIPAWNGRQQLSLNTFKKVNLFPTFLQIWRHSYCGFRLLSEDKLDLRGVTSNRQIIFGCGKPLKQHKRNSL